MQLSCVLMAEMSPCGDAAPRFCAGGGISRAMIPALILRFSLTT